MDKERHVTGKIRLNDDNRIVLASSRSTKVSLEAIRRGRAGLDTRRRTILDRIPNQGDDETFPVGTVDLMDLAYLTAKTHDEFAILRGKNTDIVFHGTPLECDIISRYGKELKSHKIELYGHSHPGEPIPEPSPADRAFLRYIGQKKSRIVSGMTGISVEFHDTI